MSAARKIAIVTGANKGIGFAIVRNLVLKSSNPLLIYAAARDPARGAQSIKDLLAEQQVAASLQAKSSEIKYLPLDIGDSNSIKNFKQTLEAEHGSGSIDILINNAGTASKGSAFNGKIAQDTLAINYYGTKEVTEALIPLIKQDGTGRIVNISSTAGRLTRLSSKALVDKFTDPSLTFSELDGLMQKFVSDIDAGNYTAEGWPSNTYAVSKIGVTALTKIFARENKNILINACCPGWVRTDMAGQNATRSPDEGTVAPLHLALDDLDGVTGEFWYDKAVTQW